MRIPPIGARAFQGEVWTCLALRSFVSQIPAPLGIGKVTLADGTTMSGFLCEAHAVENAVEITDQGGLAPSTGKKSCVSPIDTF